MSAQPDTRSAPGPSRKVRPFYWSVRRELWENRSVLVAPLAMAGFALIGVMLSTHGLPRSLRAIAAGDAKQAHALMGPYSFAAVAVLLASFVVAIFYSLSALQSERRDRSILFWKSLPVSDVTTVLSKAAIPMAVIPAVTFAIIFATQLAILVWSTLVTLGAGFSPALLWSHVDLSLMWIMVPYGLAVNALWQAPVFAWFILVSGWAKRMPILWAMLPFVGPAIIERGAFGTSHVGSFLGERFFGGFGEAFSVGGKGAAAIDNLGQVDPVRVLLLPDLWGGLVVAAALLAAAVWLRRRREPL
jgi:ABC-2 type transport system permease protein